MSPSPSEEKYLLIADDFDDAASLMASLVETVSSFRTGYARDGAEVLALAAQRRPDACLLDVDMPQVDGLEAAQRLRAMYGADRPLLIGMSGSSNRAEAVGSGVFDHVLSKPIDLMQLLMLLGESPRLGARR